MSKIRVHELAKELNKSSKDVIYALKGHGVDVESHMSTISSENADKIRKFFTQPAAKPAQKQETKNQPMAILICENGFRATTATITTII